MKHTIEIEGLPEGWEAIAYRRPYPQEYILKSEGAMKVRIRGEQPWLIIERIKPRRIVLEETDEIRGIRPGEWGEINPGDLVYNNKSNDCTYSGVHRIWREVNESDSSLNKPEIKESFVPKVGEYFRIEHQSNDRSYRGDIFLCTASDGKQVVCDMASRDKSIFTDPFIFISNEWNFYPVTEEALVASGIKKDEPKLSLSVDECREIEHYYLSWNVKKQGLINKITEFLKDK